MSSARRALWLGSLSCRSMSRNDFNDIPNILVIVEGHRSHCWLCGVAGHLAKMCPGKNSVPSPPTSEAPAAKAATLKPAAPEDALAGESQVRPLSDSSNWKEVVRRNGKKSADPPLQQDVPQKEAAPQGAAVGERNGRLSSKLKGGPRSSNRSRVQKRTSNGPSNIKSRNKSHCIRYWNSLSLRCPHLAKKASKKTIKLPKQKLSPDYWKDS